MTITIAAFVRSQTVTRGWHATRAFVGRWKKWASLTRCGWFRLRR
jgi:hypothetical protein